MEYGSGPEKVVVGGSGVEDINWRKWGCGGWE